MSLAEIKRSFLSRADGGSKDFFEKVPAALSTNRQQSICLAQDVRLNHEARWIGFSEDDSLLLMR